MPFAPFAGALIVSLLISIVGLARWWIVLPLMIGGIGTTIMLSVMAARRVGPFVNAPVVVGVDAKLALVNGAFAIAAIVAQILADRWLPPAGTRVLDGIIVVAVFVIWIRPLLGYGRLGREMSRAVKEEERASWRN